MSIAVGSRIGAYEITGALGAGGMGEVYKAIDTRLNRSVAIKVLPQHFAPDGQRLAYSSNETGRMEVYVQPFPSNGSRWQVSTAGGRQSSWRRDGKELFYATDDGKLYAVAVRSTSLFHVRAPKLLFDMHADTNARRNSYAPSADGQRFLVNTLLGGGVPPITVVVNGTAALKK